MVTSNPSQAGFGPNSTQPSLPAAIVGVTMNPVTHAPGVRQIVLTLNAAPVSVAKNGTTAVFGGLEILDFPEGGIVVLGSTMNLALAADANMVATAPLVVSLGSVTAANDATLTSTEANIIASQTATLVAGAVSAVKNAALAAVLSLSGMATASKVFLNIAGDNSASASMSAAGPSIVSVTGTITITYVPVGDN